MAALLHDLRSASTRATRDDAHRVAGAFDVEAAIASVLDRAGPREAALPADVADPSTVFRSLIDAGADRLPLPGCGRTRERWRGLARVAASDLALVKLFEGHTDALAILAELEGTNSTTRRRHESYGVWASESRDDPITIDAASGGLEAGAAVRISGRKSWCSGARIVDAGLMTARDADGGRWLVELALDGSGITVDENRWRAVGMGRSGSYDIVCDRAAARIVGARGAYLERPGFWHGGGGIAACWHGASAALGERVRALQRGRDDDHALAHLGAIDGALAAGAALLRDCADAIDRAPDADFGPQALRVRGFIADSAELIVRRAERAMGPGPFCNDRMLANLVADLPIFVRQARAEHDAASQARRLADRDGPVTEWML